MATSTIEKYERILQADPRSRIFVELARALLEAGDAARAAEVCERGLVHHPGSVQARTTRARALLALRRGDEAVRCFEEAFDTDPSSAYAAELAAEALASAGLVARALPLLEKAAALHQGDLRIQRWIATARGASDASMVAPEVFTADSTKRAASVVDGGLCPQSPSETVEVSSTGASAPTPVPTPTATPTASPTRTPTPTARPSDETESPTESASPPGAAGPDRDAEPPPAPSPLSSRPTPPPLRSPPAPGRERTDPERVLTLIPEASTKPDERAPAPEANALATPRDEEAEADAAARNYEHKLREELLAAPAPPPSFLQRNRKGVALAVLGLLAVAGSVTFAAVRAKHRSGEAREAVAAARKGIARDTIGSLKEATRVLDRARRADPKNSGAAALEAAASALLAHDYGDTAAAARARDLLGSGRAGASATSVRWLLADGGRDAAARQSAATALLDAAGAGSPLDRTLAGEILLARHDRVGARSDLEAGARATPPLLRALCALGDLDLASGDPEAALANYRLVLRAHATHPGAAIGSAEARLQLGRELPEALRTLQAVEADPGSAPRLGDRLRMDLVMGRLLAATGHSSEALEQLAAAASRYPERPEVAAAQAEALSRMGAFDRAVRAAQGAIRLAPNDPSYRELVARLELDGGRYKQLLAETATAPTRTLRLYRGIALFRLGDAPGARAELKATQHDGKMPADAAAWMALTELKLGHRREAETITKALLSAPVPSALAFVAQARLELDSSHPDLAERRFREALERDPEVPEARADLGQLLLARGRAGEARDVLEKAAARTPNDPVVRLALGRARAATGDPLGAARDLQVALEARPRDAVALVDLAGVRLAMGDPAGSRRAAERAVAINPRLAAAWIAAGRAVAAQGDRAGAQAMFNHAAKLGGSSRGGHRK